MVPEGVALSEAVIIALITGLLAVVGSYVSNVAITRKKAREDAIRDAERETRQSMRLDSIEKKLDIHNGYAEKFAESSQHLAIIDERQAVQSKRIEHIQKDIEYLGKEKK